MTLDRQLPATVGTDKVLTSLQRYLINLSQNMMTPRHSPVKRNGGVLREVISGAALAVIIVSVGDDLVCLMVQIPPGQQWKVRERTEIINIVKVDNYLANVPMSHHNLRKPRPGLCSHTVTGLVAWELAASPLLTIITQ